ncbi:MAG TPA: gamma-glutamyltransferase [Vicinamibacterales bacterium]|nr:gamma-glutamyltransferase [Vicinamibacterales bacterium]
MTFPAFRLLRPVAHRHLPAILATVAAGLLLLGVGHAQQQFVGVQEPAWAPDGKRVAVSYLDRIWVMTPDGRQSRAVTDGWSPAPGGAAAHRHVIEREPAWSADGLKLAFAADGGAGFDIYVVNLKNGAPVGAPMAVTSTPGDERWPSWTHDGRLVFAHRDAPPAGRDGDPSLQYDLYLARPAAAADVWEAGVALTDTGDSETYPRVSPDGTKVAFVSERESEDDLDLWWMPVPPAAIAKPIPLGARPPKPVTASVQSAGSDGRPLRAVRITRARGHEAYPSWAPDNTRLAFYAVREGIGSVWVATAEPPRPDANEDPLPRAKPAAQPQLVSRRGGAPAWSPDGKTLLVAGLRDPEPVYNGNPLRNETEPPPLFAMNAAFQLWKVAAPLPVHEGGGTVGADIAPSPALFGAMFDRVWGTLQSLYYSTGATAAQWTKARDTFRPRAIAAKNEAELETVIDEMVAAQPLIKPVVTTNGAVIVSGHPLASEAGRLAFEKGGNVVDAMIAVSFALGVVEPEASGIGGDGAAVLYLKGMSRPTTVEYKDMTPIKATPDNPKIMQDGRIVADGPAAANIPGVVGGLDYLYRHYGSGKVKWEDLVAPAITLAEDGFILDEGLPSSIAEGRRFLEKWPEAAKIYLPNGKVPKPGDRFFNKDYATTLRSIQKGGADAFYRGDIAKKIAADMEANGGIITFADMAQYRAIERAPVVGHYRGHALYAGGPPLSTGIQMFESLHVLENYAARPSARTITDAEYLHYAIESWKVRDPLRRVADPERWPVDYQEHLTDAHAKALFAKIDPKKTLRYERTPPDDAAVTPTAPAPRISTGTTSFAVADAEGNMIAVTQTLSTWGGTFYVSKGLGFLYNNHLRSSRVTPGAYGSMVPLMRSSTAAVPTLVFEKRPNGEEVPKLAVGCAGNAWIPLTVYNIILGVIDGRLGAQAAIEAPRFLPGRDPADPLENGERVEIEDRFPRPLLQDLIGRGHNFQKIGRKGEVRYGYAAAITVDVAARTVEGGAEPRRSHAAIPFTRGATTTSP